MIWSAGIAVALVVAAFLIAMGQTIWGWWMLICAAISSCVAAVMFARGRRLAIGAAAKAGAQAPTLGGSAAHVGLPDAVSASASQRWVGSGRVPSAIGYMEVSTRSVVLEVAHARLTFRIRPAIFRALAGMENLIVAPDDGPVVFPAHKFGQRGIEVRLPTGPSYYFWISHDRGQLLDMIMAAGFAVSGDEQHI